MVVSALQLRAHIKRLPVEIRLYSEAIHKHINGQAVPFVYDGLLVGYTDQPDQPTTLWLYCHNGQMFMLRGDSLKAFHVTDPAPQVVLPASIGYITERFLHQYKGDAE